MKTKLKKLSIDYKTIDTAVLTIEIPKMALKGFQYDISKPYSLEIKPYKEKRTLNANAYLWVLIQKIADVTDLTVGDIYRHAVREAGIYDLYSVRKSILSTFITSWEQKGKGWQVEVIGTETDGKADVIAYFGSSVYNSKQFSKLLNYIVETAEDYGISTMTESERALLVEETYKD